MRLLEIPNQEEEIRILERANFEVLCRQNIIKYMIRDGINTNSQEYKNYWNEYLLYTQAYEKLKLDFQNNIILKILGEDFQGDWEVIFDSKEVRIYD